MGLRLVAGWGSLLALGACVTAGASYDQRPYTEESLVALSYQSAYAGVLRGMRGCYGGTIIISTTTIDAQLYPDLGYGEIIFGETGIVPVITYGARIERAGTGARILYKPGAPGRPGNGQIMRWLRHWAAGGGGCPRLGSAEPPS